MPASNMSAAVTALLLTSPHRFALCRCDDRIDLLPFPLMNLLNLLPLLLYRERGVRAHRLNFLARLLVQSFDAARSPTW